MAITQVVTMQLETMMAVYWIDLKRKERCPEGNECAQMQKRLKAGKFTRALELITKWFHFLVLTSRSPSNTHANFSIGSPWAGFKLESFWKRTFSSASLIRFINSTAPPLEGVGNLKESSPSFLMGIFSPQSNSKASYLLGQECLNHVHATRGNFLALQKTKLQECKSKLIRWRSVSTTPLQTTKTNSFWPQEVLNQDSILQQVQKCIQSLVIDGHQYPTWMWHEWCMAAAQLQIMSTWRAVCRALKESTWTPLMTDGNSF